MKNYEMHVAGPDDVIVFSDKLEALQRANEVNKVYLADRAANPDSEVLCVAVVNEVEAEDSPHTPDMCEFEWGKANAHIAQDGDLFAIVMLCEEGGHWAWYVIDDEHRELLHSGSDDMFEAARGNAEKMLEHSQIVFCQACSAAGGGDRGIYHRKPACTG